MSISGIPFIQTDKANLNDIGEQIMIISGGLNSGNQRARSISLRPQIKPGC